MWSYYGTKKRIAKHYPHPQHDTIIEPFCGAAQYSLYGSNWKKNVLINDKYNIVYLLWDFLINKASEKDILSLPNLKHGDNVDDFNLSDEEKWLMGFCINSASSQPKKTVAKYNSWNHSKMDIAKNLYKVKHWSIISVSYDEISNMEATWYIDPPYQYGGEWYHSTVSNKHIDFDALSVYCKERKGQIIVCENSKADWMDFKPLVTMNGQLHTTTEVMWTNTKKVNPFDKFT